MIDPPFYTWEEQVAYLKKQRDDLRIRLSEAQERQALNNKTAERVAADNRELREKVAFLESQEVCGAAHDNVETCGYCQRDSLLKEREKLLEARRLASIASGTLRDESLDKNARIAQLENALAFWMPDEGFIPPEWEREWY